MVATRSVSAAGEPGAPGAETAALPAPAAPPVRWLFALHGIFGAGRNWHSVARRLVAARPAWGVVLPDLRLHGASKGFRPPHTLEACARDVRDLSRQAKLAPEAILGHSFGGKVALQLLRQPPAALRQVWVVDATPDPAPPSGGAWRMLALLRAHPGPFEERTEAVEGLMTAGVDARTASWMATNLERSDGHLSWRVDPDDLEALLRSFFAADVWDAVETPPSGVEIHFVRATDSGVMSAEACGRIQGAGRRNGRVFLHSLEGGHWLHADNPKGLLELLASRLS